MDTKGHYVIQVVAYEPHWMRSKKTQRILEKWNIERLPSVCNKRH